jgi:ABC-type cobalamin transport system permease subunit
MQLKFEMKARLPLSSSRALVGNCIFVGLSHPHLLSLTSLRRQRFCRSDSLRNSFLGGVLVLAVAVGSWGGHNAAEVVVDSMKKVEKEMRSKFISRPK